MIRISYNKLCETLLKIFIKEKIKSDKAKLLAKILSDSSLDGFQSHGVNRVRMTVDYLRDGTILAENDLLLIKEEKTFKQFDGQFGLGPNNAWQCTVEAIEIAKKHSIGIVTLKNNTHWQRAGTYGWKAADEGFIFICWTNTIPNLPPYGSRENLIGNNPFAIAIPHIGGNVVLDMSVSQFSYGKIASYARQNKPLPEIGGYDENNYLTKDAGKIRTGGRHLPIGFWKGSSLAIVLDLVAAILSGGMTTKEIGVKGVDSGLSQIFLAINPKRFGDEEFQNNLISNTLAQFKDKTVVGNEKIYYPGEGTLARRKENTALGIPIEKSIWKKVNSYLNN